jgi:hypothetical protein
LREGCPRPNLTPLKVCGGYFNILRRTTKKPLSIAEHHYLYNKIN